MDTINIPCSEELKVRTMQCIEEFCVHTELLNRYFREESQRIPVAKAILKQIATNRCMNGSGLYDLLAECVLTMVSESMKIKPSGVESNLPGIKKQLTVSETFDKDLTKILNDQIQELEKAMMEHRRNSNAIAKGLKSYCKTQGSVAKYTLLVDTADKSKKALENELKPQELKLREKRIKDMVKALKKRLDDADTASMRFYDLLCKEEGDRHKMTQLADNIQYNISFKLQVQLIDGLGDLRSIVTDYVADQKLERLLSKINSVNIPAIVEDLYRASSVGYTFPVPREYHVQYGFSSKLPRSTLTQVNKAAIINTVTGQECIRSNNYIKAKSLSEISQPGFLTLKKGMRIKQKANLSQEKIGFGWTRTLPWMSKRWGFFETDIACNV